MNTRSALVAVTQTHEGPWQRSQGNESGIRIRGLEEGATITLRSEYNRQLQLPIHFNKDGSYDFPSPSTRWRVDKVAGPVPRETFVQVVLK